MAIGMRAWWFRFPFCCFSTHVSEPNVYSFSGAVCREKVTLKVVEPPSGMTIFDGETVAVVPGGADTFASYCTSWSVTFVSVRVTVREPARSPMAIEGTFRLLGSMLPNATQFPLLGGSWPVPH